MCHPESFGIPTENNQETLVMWVWIGWCVRLPERRPGSSVRNYKKIIMVDWTKALPCR